MNAPPPRKETTQEQRVPPWLAYDSLLEQARSLVRRLLEEDGQLNRRAIAALVELQGMIAAKYPTAAFGVSIGEEPVSFRLHAAVDVQDEEEVFDLVMDRLLELQVDEGLCVYVFPHRARERILADLQAGKRTGTE